MATFRWMKAICFTMAGAVLLSMTACQNTDAPSKHGEYQPVKLSKSTIDLMTNIVAASNDSKTPDDAFINNSSDFAIKLFKQSIENNKTP